MQISQKGIDLICEFEGCVLHAYYDSVHVLTIGIGTTNADSDIIDTTIYPGMTITQETAEKWLELSVNKKYVPKVMKYDSIYHWNQNQLDALTSFAYNIGSIDQLTANGTRTIDEISNKILAYDKANGQTLAGLTRRRKAEKELFDTPVEKWVEDTIGWRYQLNNGSFVKSNWKEVNGKWYYFKSNCYMASDEYIKASDYDRSKKLYYVAKSGAWDNKAYIIMNDMKGRWLEIITGGWYAKNSWLKINSRWYYAGDDGYFYRNCTTKIKEKLYHFDGKGAATEVKK